jgi:signal transduction histidine kinase
LGDSSIRIARAISSACAIYAIVGAGITLAGWLLELPRLTDWRNDDIAMFPNPAICAMLLGVGLLLVKGLHFADWKYNVARAFAGIVALVAVLTMFEHATGTNLGIDTLIADKPWGQGASVSPMRMGLPASTSLLVLGAGLILSTFGADLRRIASGLAILVVAITSLSLIGYWFGSNELFGIALYTAIAWQTSTIIAALAIGLIASVPERGLAAALRRDDAGGAVLRRLIVPVIGVPLLLGWMVVVAEGAKLYDLQFGTAIRTVMEIVLLVSLLWWTVEGISRHAAAARKAERALRESEQRYREIAAAAKDADRRKDEFLATLAHELRNPLAPIGNAISLLRIGGMNGDVAQQAHDTIERQFSQMVRLVDDLLDVGRITRDKLELRKEPVELGPIIQQAAEATRPAAEAAGHELQLSLPGERVWVDADAVRLGQVFVNLLNNACKFSERAGTIAFSAEPVDSQVTVTVKDTGIGIAPEKIETIFDMFEQADKSLERARGGLGIGLTLVRRLVELHGGNVTARSDGPGRGSEFVVRLPVLDRAEQSAAASPQPNGAVVSRRRILVTDDNQDAATTLVMLLELKGHEVEAAHDGRSALERAESWRPDVMLLDLGMPGMNGYDVCKSIRKTIWGAEIQIVALTGWGQEQDRLNTSEAGFDGHLVKPVDLNALDAVLLPRG